MNTSNTDINVIVEFKQGNPKAFEDLFYRHHQKLYAFLLNLTHSKFDSEEILQQVFVRIWEKRDLFNEQYPFETFLFKVAKNTFLNYTRKKINQRIVDQNIELYTELTAENADSYFMLRETNELIESIISSMPPKRQQIFRMQKIEGLSRKEISEKLQLSVVTIDTHLAKANKDVLTALKRYGILAVALTLFP
ncbi:MAG: RNA polymerase sigma factor [Mangrovibacterium sp.]